MVYGLFIYRYPAARWQKHPHLKSPFPPKKSCPFSAHASCSEGHRASTQHENTITISWIRKLKVIATQPSNGSSENHSWEDDSRTSILNPQTSSVYGIKPGAEGKHTLTCTRVRAHTSQSVRWFHDRVVRHFWVLWPWRRHRTSLCSIPSSSWMWELTEL